MIEVNVEALVLTALLLAVFAGVGAVLLVTIRHWNRTDRTPAGSISVLCSVCQHRMVFHRSELVPLAAVDRGLVVCTYPEMTKKPLMEYVCPYCESNHCFTQEHGELRLVGTNLYTPQGKTSHCMECHKPLARPAWPPHTYDQRVTEAPLTADHGLECQRCGAVCCVACCVRTTGKRTADGSYLCPRCGRGPLAKVFHF